MASEFPRPPRSLLSRVLGVARVSTAALVILALAALWLPSWSAAPVDAEAGRADVRRRLAFIERSIREEDGLRRMQWLFPEGSAFTVVLYGMAWANRGREFPVGSPERAEAARQLRWALDLYDTDVVTRPFHDTQVRLGVFWLGQRNLLLAEWAELAEPTGRDAELLAEFHRNSQELAAAFAARESVHLDAYRGLSWPVDNVTALTSLVLHDRLFGTDHGAAYRRWKAWTLDHLDPGTGLIAGHVDSDTGELLQPGRGSTTGWTIPLLMRIDPEFARSQLAAAREHLHLRRLGFRMVREWPATSERGMDIDSGPIVLGAGCTATGVALAAARSVGDVDTAADVHALAAMFGRPSTDGDETRYLYGELPVGDAFLAWGASIPLATDESAAPRSWFDLLLERWSFHLLALGTIGLAAWWGGGVWRRRGTLV